MHYSAFQKAESLLPPCSVDPEKEYTCQKGILVANWAPIHNQSLAAVVYRGPLSLCHSLSLSLPPLCLSHTYTDTHTHTPWISGKSHRLSCQASCTMFLLFESNFRKEFLGLYFHQWTETCPIQSEPCSYILICIFSNQSEWPHNSNQKVQFWPIETVLFEPIKLCKFGLLICIKMDQAVPGWAFSLYKWSLPFVSRAPTFGFFQRPVSPLFKLFSWMRSSFSTPHIGDSYWYWIGSSYFLLTEA